MKKIFSMLLLMLMVFSANVMMAQQMPPIPVDDQVRIGHLDCGLTYYIRHNNYPENRVNFYIAQRVGSIQEEESQRGLAHFLEHMAFNGSEHFNGEGKGIIDYTRSLGVNFGGDLPERYRLVSAHPQRLEHRSAAHRRGNRQGARRHP